jgi:hypothetical protein
MDESLFCNSAEGVSAQEVEPVDEDSEAKNLVKAVCLDFDLLF